MEDGLGIVEDISELFFTDNGLQNGQPYYYAVSALNADGEGEKTQVMEATPQSNTSLMTEVNIGDWTNVHTIYVGEGVYFYMAGGIHNIVVDSVTSNSVLMSVSWDSQYLTLNERDSQIIDVNGDGKDDFKVTCDTITSEPAEGFPQTVQFSFTTKNLGGSTDGKTPGFELLLFVLAGLMVVGFISLGRYSRWM
jgi:hypothetical protein